MATTGSLRDQDLSRLDWSKKQAKKRPRIASRPRMLSTNPSGDGQLAPSYQLTRKNWAVPVAGSVRGEVPVTFV